MKATLHSFALLLMTCSCAVGPRVVADLAEHESRVLSVMRMHSRYPVQAPARIDDLGQGWPDTRHGRVIAIDGSMLAVRWNQPELVPDDMDGRRLMISSPSGWLPKGDGVVVARLHDLAICRYFPNRHGSPRPVELTDEASFDP